MKRVGIILLALAAVFAVAVALHLHRSRDEVSVVSGRDAARIVGADARTAEVDRGLRPEPGTYRYVGGGREHLSLLGGSEHEFPEAVTAIVQLDPNDDCRWTLDLVLIEEHVEERSYCTTAAGTRDLGFARTTTFLGREQTSTYACTDDAMRRRSNARPGTTWRWSCTEERGGVVQYTGTHVGTESVRVGSTDLRASHLRVTARQRDKSTGDERSDWWLLDSGLPARIVSERSLVSTAGPLGEMRLDERIELTLAAAAPQALP